MKAIFSPKTLVPMALAMALALISVNEAQSQPQPGAPAAPPPPPATATALPADIVPGTPLAEVVRLVQAGVDVPTIQSFIATAQGPFNLDADKIIFLKDEGVPSEIINAMLERDKVLYAANITPQPTTTSAPPPYPTGATSPPDTAPPTEEVNTTYFYNTLSPYGSWVDVDGYGQCWRPTAVIYDWGWRPYCDRGRWTYTDCGWYWDSDYAWGATFHYGRWFRSPRFGWCWYPDTVWAPSWVTWRSDTDYCGWAPLPPFAVFRPGAGFFYRGAGVSFDFDFGLPADCFVFIPPIHFCDRHPRNFCADQRNVPNIFHRSTVVNDFNVNSHHIVNRGINVDHIASAGHRKIEPVHVSSLPNAGRQGWRGDGFQQTMGRTTFGNNTSGHTVSTGNNQSGHGVNTTGNPNAVHYDSTHHIPPTGNATISGNARNSGNAIGNGTANAGNNTHGTQPGGNSIVVYGSQAQNHAASTGNTLPNSSHPDSATHVYQQQQQFQQGQQHQFQQTPIQPQPIPQQPTRHVDTYTAPNQGVSQNAQNGYQTHNYNNSSSAVGSPYHGAEQLQPHQAPQNSSVQSSADTGAHVYSQPSSSSGQGASQGQSHASGGGGGGSSSGGGGGGGNSSRGSNDNGHGNR